MGLGSVDSIYVDDRHPVRSVGVDLSQLTVLIGRNDSGKSTLLSCFADILDASLPTSQRPGWWTPTPEIAADVRAQLGWTGDQQVRLVGDERGAGALVQGDPAAPPERLPDGIAARLAAPVGSIVRIEPGTSRVLAAASIRALLVGVVADTIAAGATVPGRSTDPEDPVHFIAATGVQQAWTVGACEALASAAFELMPRFVCSVYDSVSITLRSSAGDGWEPVVELVDDYGRCPHGELASGVRTWLNLALTEAARRLANDVIVIDGDVVEISDQPDPSTLYLVDEPEQHLHPQAALEVAEWFYSLSQQQGFGVIVATHSPAFVGLANRSGVEVVVCTRADLPDDDVDHSVTACTRWSPMQLARLAEQADASGITVADAFLTGSVPVLVEGRHDHLYFNRAWQLVCGASAESLGVRLIPVSGLANLEILLAEVVGRLYPAESPVYLITDDPSLDAVGNERTVAQAQRIHPQLQVRSHDAFDVLALIPEHRFRDQGITVRSTWHAVERTRLQRRDAENRTGRAGGPWPNKTSVLEQPDSVALVRVLSSFSLREVRPSVVSIIEEITRIASHAAPR